MLPITESGLIVCWLGIIKATWHIGATKIQYFVIRIIKNI